VSDPKKRPGPLWLLFYGRQRRGFPWLLVVLVVTIIALSLSFAIPGGADMWRAVAPIIFGLFTVAAVGLVIAALFRKPRRPR
jgi:hypothetical protein